MLSDIVRSVGQFRFQVNGEIVGAQYLEYLSDRIDTAEIPVRIIRVSSNLDTGFVYMTCLSEELTRADWQLRDLCLWRPVASGSGLEEVENQIVDYADMYMAKIQQFTQSEIKRGHKIDVTGLTMTIGQFEYPLGSTEQYHGVEILLTIREHLI